MRYLSINAAFVFCILGLGNETLTCLFFYSNDSQTNLGRKSPSDEEASSTGNVKAKQRKPKSTQMKPAPLKQQLEPEEEEEGEEEFKPGEEGGFFPVCVST